MNGRDADTATPLHWAVYNGHLEIAKLLVASGASLTARTKDGQTPLHWAALAGRMLCLHYLVKCGADLRAVDSCGYNMVHLGAQNNKPFVVFYGINSGIPIDATGLFLTLFFSSLMIVLFTHHTNTNSLTSFSQRKNRQRWTYGITLGGI